MIEQVLLTDGFYYSTTYDLTHTLQRLSKTSPDFLQMPLHERVIKIFYLPQVTIVLKHF